jgi:hypothetical protein
MFFLKKKNNKTLPQNTSTTSITKSTPQTTIIKKSKTQIGYRNRIKKKEEGNRGTKEKTKKPSPNTAVAEPDHIVISGRRSITSPPPSQPRAPPDLPLATPPSLSGVPPPLRISSLSLSLVLLALCFHLLLFYFVCFIQ